MVVTWLQMTFASAHTIAAIACDVEVDDNEVKLYRQCAAIIVVAIAATAAVTIFLIAENPNCEQQNYRNYVNFHFTFHFAVAAIPFSLYSSFRMCLCRSLSSISCAHDSRIQIKLWKR